MKSKPEEKNKGATNHPTQHHWHEMNRKERRETMRKIQSEDRSLEVIHPDAAGIDIGNESHYAAVPPRSGIRCRYQCPRRRDGSLPGCGLRSGFSAWSPVAICGSSRANGAVLDGWLLFCFSPVVWLSC